MTEKNAYSAVIVGGGIIGLSIALALQKRGVSVALLERGKLGGGASGGNAGHIATEQVFPIASPDILMRLPAMLLDELGPLRLDWRYLPTITPWLLRLLGNMTPKRTKAIHQALLALNGNSFAAWKTFASQWGIERYVKTEGSVLVVEKTENIIKLQNHGQTLNRIGIRNEWWDKHSLHERIPVLAKSQTGGLFYPDTGHIVDLDGVFDSLRASFLAGGGILKEYYEVQDIRLSAAGEYEIFCDTQENICSEYLILATGAFSKKWVKHLENIDIPLDTERGYHLMVPDAANLLSIPVSSYERKFIMTPMQQGLRLAGTVEFAGLERPATMSRAHNLLYLAKGMLADDMDIKADKPWMGFRPSLPDSLPVIDRRGKVLFAFGHQHLGLTQAPFTAALIERLYFNESTDIDLTPYRLNRF